MTVLEDREREKLLHSRLEVEVPANVFRTEGYYNIEDVCIIEYIGQPEHFNTGNLF